MRHEPTSHHSQLTDRLHPERLSSHGSSTRPGLIPGPGPSASSGVQTATSFAGGVSSAHLQPPSDQLLARAGALRMQRPPGPSSSEPALAGRSAQLDQLKDFLKGQRAIQLLGEARMGTSHTLAWAWWTLIQEDRSAALIDAARLERKDHTGLLLAIARSLGREGLEARVLRALSAAAGADLEAALRLLVPAYVLIDHADALEDAEPAFPKSFFNAWRSLNERGTERGRLVWVSAARSCVYQKFKSRGTAGAFLNDAAKIWLGALEPQAARSWLETRLGGPERVRLLLPNAVPHILDVTGGFAAGLHWFSEQVLDRPDQLDDITDGFHTHFNPVFHTWWQHRDALERALLKRCAQERPDVRIFKAQDRRTERLTIRRLESLGLVAEQNGCYVIPGSAWRSFVLASRL